MSETLRLAHASDLHIRGPWSWAPWRYLPKRFIGAVNYGVRRWPEHPPAVAAALVRELATLDADHLVLTGDFTNISFETEFATARAVLEPVIARGAAFTSVIAGNHDSYTYASERAQVFEKTFGDLQTSDVALEWGQGYPFVRLRKGVAIIGLDSAVATLPGFASGALGAWQLERLARVFALREVKDARFRVVLVHHALLRQDGLRDRWLHRLRDDRELIAALALGRADLVLHGHLHQPYALELESAGHRFKVFNAGSSTRLHPAPEKMGGYNVYVIEGDRLAAVESRTYRPETGAFDGRRTFEPRRVTWP